MKYSLSIFFLFFYFIGFTQFDLEYHTIVDANQLQTNINVVFSADLDGDGDDDIVSGSFSRNNIVWHENLDGEGLFGKPIVISSSGVSVHSIVLSDIDNDGDIDILAAMGDYSDIFNTSEIVWFENLNGKGFFDMKKIISDEAIFPNKILSSDIDGDGDLDVISSSSHDNKIAWYKNDGSGLFGEQIIISTEVEYVTSCFVADVDGDGDLDVLSSSRKDNKIAWYENIDGNFSSDQHIISNEVEGASIVYAADFDSDGDTDIITSSGNELLWFKNNGSVIFEEHQRINVDGSSSDIIVKDIDKDGDLDVVFGNYTNLGWLRNENGKGLFSDRIPILNMGNDISSVFVSNIDGDDDLDICFSSRRMTKLGWYRNFGGKGDFPKQNVIISSVSPIWSFDINDLEQDGHSDLLTSVANPFGDSKICWYSDLTSDYSRQIIVGEYEEMVIHVQSVDVNNDGWADIVGLLRNGELFWHENLKEGSFSDKIGISNSCGLSLSAADIDGDGDFDLVVPSLCEGRVNWFENEDGKGNFRVHSGIELENVMKINVADVDNDGDNDIVCSTDIDTHVLINLDGKGIFENLITLDGFNAFLIDMNQDGLLDVITKDFRNVYWYRNYGPDHFSFQFSIQTTISTSIDISDIDGVNMDGDEDADIIAILNNNRVVWFENNDNKLLEPKILKNKISHIQYLETKDVDGDNDLDILVGGRRKVFWFENLGEPSLTINSNDRNLSIYPIPTHQNIFVNSNLSIKIIEIFNYYGQALMSVKNQKSIDISKLTNGIYFCKITDINGTIYSQKIIKM